VPGATGLPVLEDCQLAILLPDRGAVILGARVVMPSDQQQQLGGVGLSLDTGYRPILEGLLAQLEEADQPSVEPAIEPALSVSDPAPARAASVDVVDSPVTRLSRLSMPEKLKRIRKSQILSERNMLERMLGKTGWEALLQNPRLTIPEVAKLARKGTMPKPTLEKIVENKAWLAASPVRRALLQNPKLPRTAITQVLRGVPRRELELMVRGAAYPPAVRDAIRRLLGNKP